MTRTADVGDSSDAFKRAQDIVVKGNEDRCDIAWVRCVSRETERGVSRRGCDLCVLCTISVWRVPVARRPQTPSRSNFLSREALPLRAHGERGKDLNTTGLRFIFFLQVHVTTGRTRRAGSRTETTD